MPPPEIAITCAGCGNRSTMPIASIRRDSSYCGKCGKRLEFANVTIPTANRETTDVRHKPKKSSKPAKRR